MSITPATLDVAIGRNLLIFITPQIKNGPLFTPASIGTLSFTGRFSDIDYDFPTTTENLSPVGSFNANPVPWEQSGRVQLTEFTFATPIVSDSVKIFPNSNVLRACAGISRYHLIEIQEWDNDTSSNQIDDLQIYMVMTTPIHRTGSKPRVMDSAIFELIPLVDAATGLFAPNPFFNDYGPTS